MVLKQCIKKEKARTGTLDSSVSSDWFGSDWSSYPDTYWWSQMGVSGYVAQIFSHGVYLRGWATASGFSLVTGRNPLHAYNNFQLPSPQVQVGTFCFPLSDHLSAVFAPSFDL